MVPSGSPKNDNQMQVWLPITMRSDTQEAGADLKESGLFKCLSSVKMGNSCLKAHLHISVEAEVFIRRGKGMEQRDQGRGLKSSLHAD